MQTGDTPDPPSADRDRRAGGALTGAGRPARRVRLASAIAIALGLCPLGLPRTASAQLALRLSSPTPLAMRDQPVDWIFAFKLNAGAFPSTERPEDRHCAFGGEPVEYLKWSQRYAFATSQAPTLTAGPGLLGTTPADPLGATFDQIWNGGLHYVVWNDQLYRHPEISGCSNSCGAPWGHSKGVLAWNDAGEGVVLQVTTPSWPAAADANRPRAGDGNTLGCVEDNDVKVSQDFFALRLTEPDVEKVLDALANASVVTNVADRTLVNNGGPPAISARVAMLGRRSDGAVPFDVMLSTGVRLISKPSALHVPPWQLVSALLGGVDLRTATWWAKPAIPTTTRDTPLGCWSSSLPPPGGVEVATSGIWDGVRIGLKGGLPADGNHAKIGVSTSGRANYTVFGDMNQQGTLSGRCDSSQNGRGGLFYVVDNAALNAGVSALIAGDTAPAAPADPPMRPTP